MMPIIPYLTDSYENLDNIYKRASDINVDYVLTGTLYLRGKTRPYFLSFLKNVYPDIYFKFMELYKTGGAGVEYKKELYKKIYEIKSIYNMSSDYNKVMREKLNK
jgi:DNA repair photolyase